jgi:hypothetical protein
MRALAALIICMGAGPALADARQDWIHKNRPSCCDHRDCFPAKVDYTVNGWKVEGAEKLVTEIVPWPFGEPFACWNGKTVRCLLMRESGQ